MARGNHRRSGDGVPLSSIIGESAGMRDVRAWIERVARTDLDVLITGETGTGKELVARAIHYLSGLTVFRAVNMATLPANLIESMLFGHLKGSFTGADRDSRGLFVAADGGTLFMDEIGELPLELQPKLLRALDYGEIMPVGADDVRHVRVRVISATSRDLAEEVRRGRFREDLRWRLNPASIHLPALREGTGDVALLVRQFAQGRDVMADAMIALETHAWPGNVRELKHVIEYGCKMGDGQRLRLADLPEEIRRRSGAASENGVHAIRTLREIGDEYIAKVLNLTEGNRGEAAKLLGIDRSTLRRRLR